MLTLATIGTSPISENLIEAAGMSAHYAYAGTLSRDAERAAAFTRAHGGTHPFTRLEDIARADDIDVVYIASPNALHAQQALPLIAAGKHLLVEKPFAANAREAQRVFDAAQAAGVCVMEAMRPLHDPGFPIIRDALARIGRVRRATVRFGKYSSRYDELLAGGSTNIFDCAMASGALMDIGIYCIEPALALFGKPEHVHAEAILLDQDTRARTHGALDGAGSAFLRYPDMVCDIAWSKITDDDLALQVEGEQGTVTVDSVSIPRNLTIQIRGRALRADAKVMRATEGGSSERIALPGAANTMVHELDDFADAVHAVQKGCAPDQAPAGPLGTLGTYRAITLDALALTDTIRHRAGIVFPADAR